MTSLSIGADECAWGTLAGPFVCCAVAATPMQITEISAIDSKRLKGLTKLSQVVRRNMSNITAHSIVIVSADRLAALGYARAREFAFNLAIQRCRRKVAPRCPRATIDGSDTFKVPFSRAIVKADDQFPTVSMASCLGKAHQLMLMHRLDKEYPEYGFANHAGYGTPQHLEALQKYGAIPHIHRLPVIRKMFRNRGLKFFTRIEQ